MAICDPFDVLARVAPNAYKLALPLDLLARNIHSVLNVSQLKIYRSATPLFDASNPAENRSLAEDAHVAAYDDDVLVADEPGDTQHHFPHSEISLWLGSS